MKLLSRKDIENIKKNIRNIIEEDNNLYIDKHNNARDELDSIVNYEVEIFISNLRIAIKEQLTF